jgi:hypothetical protein
VYTAREHRHIPSNSTDQCCQFQIGINQLTSHILWWREYKLVMVELNGASTSMNNQRNNANKGSERGVCRFLSGVAESASKYEHVPIVRPLNSNGLPVS